MNGVMVALGLVVGLGLLVAWHAQRRARSLDTMVVILLVPVLGPLWYIGQEVYGWTRRALPHPTQGRRPRSGFDAALIDLEREDDPSPGTLIRAADAALADGRAEAAEHYYLQAIASIADNARHGGHAPDAWRVNLARAQLDQGKAAEALNSLQGLAIAGNEPLAVLTARALDLLDRSDEACAALEPHLTGFTTEEVPYRYAQLLEKRGSGTVAMKLYEEIVARAESSPRVLQGNIAWVRLAVERLHQYSHPNMPPTA